MGSYASGSASASATATRGSVTPSAELCSITSGLTAKTDTSIGSADVLDIVKTAELVSPGATCPPYHGVIGKTAGGSENRGSCNWVEFVFSIAFWSAERTLVYVASLYTMNGPEPDM